MKMSKSSQIKLEKMPIVDNDGNVYVLSVFSNAVYKYTADGKFAMSFGSGASELDDFDNADAFAVDHMGNVYISESDQIHFFLPDGRFVRRFNADTLAVEAPEAVSVWSVGSSAANLWSSYPLVA